MKNKIIATMLILTCIFLITLVIAETITIYANKDITLTAEQKNVLASKNLLSYNIEDYQVTINGNLSTKRCIINNRNLTIGCFAVRNDNLRANEITTKLDAMEKTYMERIANNGIKQTQTKIGQGTTNIK